MPARAKKASYKAAAKQFIKKHPDVVKYWSTGNLH